MKDGEHPLAGIAAQSTTDKIYLSARFQSNPAGNAAVEKHATNPAMVAVAESYFSDPERLSGDRLPDTVIQNERPVHRMMIWMHAQGAGVKDIATHTGYTEGAVRNILRQPWARQRLLQILKETGLDAVKHFLTHEVAPSLEVLREIRDGEIPGKASDRAGAANSILDRALGKPTVHVESDSTTRNVPADLQRLEAEIAATRQQLAERGQLENGTGPN